MPITIRTYTDPYRLNEEPIWDTIKSSLYFCSTQTLVNGMRSAYGSELTEKPMTTVKKLTDRLFGDWGDITRTVEQHAHVDALLSEGVGRELFVGRPSGIISSDISSLVASLRILRELDVNPAAIRRDRLSRNQELLVKLYETISDEGEEAFRIPCPSSLEEFDNALADVLETIPGAGSGLNFGTVVFHGIHQFNPITLKAIEELAHYKEVILLFNYQPQYESLYQTWLDVYDAFDSPTAYSQHAEFRPSPSLEESYEGNLVADRMGMLADGNVVGPVMPFEMLEFDSMTEFAGYVADVYDAARREDPVEPLRAMHEQFYSADSSANDILRLYFPKQFGRPTFCDYPLGRFFVTLAQMWDPEKRSLRITDESALRDCIASGAIPGFDPRKLIGALESSSALVEGCSGPAELAKRIKKIQRKRERLQGDAIAHVSYLSCPSEDLENLRLALETVCELSEKLFGSFSDKEGSVGQFAKNMASIIVNSAKESPTMTDEAREAAEVALDNMGRVSALETTVSFRCLKETLPLLLGQQDNDSGSANWIVRNFEQVDGDILRSQRSKTVYHFACLSDEDMSSSSKPRYPWPLDSDFFLYAQDPIDWKCQVYVKAREEYRNFRPYALLYGMEFNRSGYKLSYIRRGEHGDKSPYFLLKMLGVSTKPYDCAKRGKRFIDSTMIDSSGYRTAGFTEYDLYRLRICRHRFLLDSLIQGDTVYSDGFLLSKYAEVLLEKNVSKQIEGFPKSERLVAEKVSEACDSIASLFPFLREAGRIDITRAASMQLLKSTGKNSSTFAGLDEREAQIRELFIRSSLMVNGRGDILRGKFDRPDDAEMANAFSDASLSKIEFHRDADAWCIYCPWRQTCAPSAASAEE